MFVVGAALGLPVASSAQCNTAPIAVNDTILHTGDSLRIHVLDNDEDFDGDALEVTVQENTCSGSVTEDFGTLVLTPDIDSSETCAIDYQVADGRGGTATARVSVKTTGLLFKDSFETGDTNRWDDEMAR